jgi:hypothetical protein
MPQEASEPIPGQIRQGIVESLSDLPVEFVWVEGQDEVPLEDDVIAGDGASIALGNVHTVEQDRTVMVSARLDLASLGVGAQTYILGQVEGEWQVQSAMRAPVSDG